DSCLGINRPMIPPARKKNPDAARYMIPIRLWSVVTSQLATRPRCQAGIGVSALTATEDVLLEVVDQCVHLPVCPVLAHRRHQAATIPDDLRDRRVVLEKTVPLQPWADVAFAGEAVALRAGTRERLLAE